MPIKNLLEARGRLPRLGVIRLGIKEVETHRVCGGKGCGKCDRGQVSYPKEVPYFVLPDSLEGLRKKVGDRPTSLSIMFPSDDPGRVLTSWYERYQGKLLTLRCDGERFLEIPKQGPERSGACQKPGPREPCSCRAEAMGRLNVILLDGPLGVWQIPIGGESRIADLMVELEVFRRALGRLTDIVFELVRVPTEVQIRTEDGSRMSRTGWPVHVRCAFTAAQALKASGRALPMALPEGEPGQVVEREGEAVGHEVDEEATLPQPPDTPQPPDAPWDVSMCFSSAAKLGIEAAQYVAYLWAVYQTDVDNLPDRAIQEQRRLLETALAEGGAEHRDKVLNVAKRTMQQHGDKIRALCGQMGLRLS